MCGALSTVSKLALGPTAVRAAVNVNTVRQPFCITSKEIHTAMLRHHNHKETPQCV